MRNYTETIHILRVDGTTDVYPIKHYNSFGDLPGVVQEQVVAGVKAEIKQRYENGERTHIHCFPPHLSDAFVHEGHFHDVILTRIDDMGADLVAYCNSLFGQNLPYIVVDGSHIYFVKNADRLIQPRQTAPYTTA